MILGISGKMGAGKDTVGQIIQYLTTNPENLRVNPVFNQGFEYSLKYSQMKKGFPFHNSDWKIKKFAGKLKQIVCLLTGCTLEELEDPDFKTKTLPKEWSYVLGSNNEPLPISTYSEDDVFKANPARFTKEYTYRDFLQMLGTNACRKVLHENVWINALFADYTSTVWDPLINNFVNPNWIITDVRFPNEFDAIKDKGGINIRVNTSRAGIVSNHVSETALDNHNFDYVIDNSSSISDLMYKVKEILIIEKIIKNE